MIRKHKPTIDDVAREAGISQTTASYILSGSKHADRISFSTKQRILAAAKRLGYSRNSIGAALQRGYSDNIILLAVNWELASAHSKTMVSASRAAALSGLSTIVHVAGDDEEAALFLQNISSLNPYGLLLLWDSAAEPDLKILELRESGLPVVELIPCSTKGGICVTEDRKQGMFAATSHLIELGHRRIGFLLDLTSRWRTSSHKLAGYKKALYTAGIDFDESLLQETWGPYFESGKLGFRNLISRHNDITAVMCINDPMALGAIASAQEIGMRVPKDLSVVGYGNHDDSEYFYPKLTTLSVSAKDLAIHAVQLLQKIRTDVDCKPRSKYLPMEIELRESTSPPSGEYPISNSKR
ncbi:MAG: LacI family DNA-binding transcriptional regulator [Armatimonadota bacterium]|nr:LacI family transcriptional regulator [bacterium]